MAKVYRTGAGTRMVNVPFRVLARLGLGRSYRHILTVRGRKTGRLYTTPVDVMWDGSQRWLVAPYGVTSWVHNARAAGEVTLTRGRRSQTVRATELGPEQSVPVLRRYLREVPVTRPYFDVTLDSGDEEFMAEAPRHPVFRLSPLSEHQRRAAGEGTGERGSPAPGDEVDGG